MTDRSPSAAARAADEPVDEGERPLEIPADRLVQDWRQARVRAVAYAEALGIEASKREALAQQALERAVGRSTWEAGADAIGETLRALRELVLERMPLGATLGEGGADDFTAWRLEAAPPTASGRARRTCVPACLPRDTAA